MNLFWALLEITFGELNMVIKRFLKKVGLSIEDVLGEFEILGVCFIKEDMDIGSLRKIVLLENNGRVHDIMYYWRMDSQTDGILWRSDH